MTETTNDILNSAAAEAAAPVRYIKLGAGGIWVNRSFAAGEIHFGHREVPHDLALSGDREAIVRHLVARGRHPGKAASAAREVLDFYQLGAETVWITFARGHLWWARAETEVVPAEVSEASGARFRRTIGDWSCRDAHDELLRQDQLSSTLTKVASFRQTLCRVEASGYLLRRLAGKEEPIVRRARERYEALLTSYEDMIAALHWRDFETLIDVILTKGGWHRVSRLGGSMADADMIVEQALTGEQAFVQVKSSASQAVLERYIGIFDESGSWSRMIFACHSPVRNLVSEREDVMVWTQRRLAEIAARNGLFEWLAEKTS